MYILSPEIDICPSSVSRRERITIENISWTISMKEYCWPGWGPTHKLWSPVRCASNWATKAGSTNCMPCRCLSQGVAQMWIANIHAIFTFWLLRPYILSKTVHELIMPWSYCNSDNHSHDHFVRCIMPKDAFNLDHSLGLITNWWYFSYFSQKTGFDISCKLSPLETICMKCQILFSGKNISKCPLLNFSPRVLSINL